MLDLTTGFHRLPRPLFPALEEEIRPLTALDQPFCEVVSLAQLGRFTGGYEWCGEGRPPCSRLGLAHAFIAQHVYQFPTTGALIHALQTRPTLRRLCGWNSVGEVPSEPTFSRAFAEFTADQLPQRIHENRGQVHAGPRLVGPVSRDATALAAPEQRPAPNGSPAVGRQALQPKLVQSQLSPQMQRQPASTPLPRPAQLECLQAQANDLLIGLRFDDLILGRQSQGRRRLVGLVFQEGFHRFAPGQVLRIADFTRVKHVALDHPAIGQSLVLDDAPGAMLLAVLLADLAAHKHNRSPLCTDKNPWK